MGNSAYWLDLRTIVAACSLIFGIVQWRLKNREVSFDSLSDILQKMFRTSQHFYKANNSRRKRKQIRVSFPSQEKAKEASRRIEMLLDDYSESIKAAETEFREVEAEIAARSFRFPDAVSRMLKVAFDSLSECGKAVNEGWFEQADVHFAKFRDDCKDIAKAGRGWRLADPIQRVRKLVVKEKAEKPVERFEVSEKDMDAIMALVVKRATSQSDNTFAIHPPKKLIEHPEIAKSDAVIDELEDSIFMVVFQDGTTRLMTLVELMVFVYNLIALQQQLRGVPRMRAAMPAVDGEVRIEAKILFELKHIMRVETVKLLLDKIDFSAVPSDEETGEGKSNPEVL